MRTFYAVYGVLQRINRVAVALACVCIVVMILATDWEAITRYFFRNPAMWTYPVSSYLLLYSIYLAMAYTLQKGGHVQVEVFTEMLPPRARVWMERFSHLLGLIFTFIFTEQGWRLFLRQVAEGERDISALSIPLAWVSFAIPLGLTLMSATYVFVLIESFLVKPGQLTLQERYRSEARPETQLD